MRKYLFTIVMSFSLIIFGLVLTVSEISDFTIKEDFNENAFTKREVIYENAITKPVVEIETKNTKNAAIVYDDRVAEGTIKIIVNYYDDLLSIDKFNLTNTNSEIIYITADEGYAMNTAKGLFDVTIEGLRNKEIYNYVEALKPDIKILVNTNDKEVVKVRR